jgi:hypothetical protein
MGQLVLILLITQPVKYLLYRKLGYGGVKVGQKESLY